MLYIRVGVALMLFFLPNNGEREIRAWPEVRATRHRWAFANLASDTPVRYSITDRRGAALYSLECHNGDYEGDSGYDYSGDFHCALFAVSEGKRASWNLLATEDAIEQSSDWYNRGRMLAAQLRGLCAATAWGTTRVFRMRAMRVTFRFVDLVWDETGRAVPRLKRFALDLSVAPDESAASETAERVSDRPCFE